MQRIPYSMSEVHHPKRAEAAKLFSPEKGRDEILKKSEKAGAKGVLRFFGEKTAETRRIVLAEVLQALESEGEIIKVIRGVRARYYGREFAPLMPTPALVAPKLERAATERFPQIMNEPELRKILSKEEKPVFTEALAFLLEQRDLIVLKRKNTAYYISARAVGTGGPVGSPGVHASAAALPVDEVRVREAYRQLVRDTGFPDVAIAGLHRASGESLSGLKRWIEGEHRRGKAVLSFGDWSLADETKRSGAIEIDGDRYLLARLIE